MRRIGRVAVALVLTLPAAASAAPVTIEGWVTDASSRWTSDHSRIVTEATIMTAAGPVTVSQLGGTVNGLTMRTFPGPEPMRPGMRVAVAASAARDRSSRPHMVVDSMRVLEQPPGFVRTGPTLAGNSLYWESGCVFVAVDSAGTNAIPGDTEREAIDQAINEWNTAPTSCSYLKLEFDGLSDAEVGRDYVNLIKFRDVSWCRPAVDDDPPRCYPGSAAGITTAVYVDDATSDRDGAIVDADIELNGVDFAISKDGVTLSGAGCQADLANTLTHELGHLHGLEHPCVTAGDPARVDHNGDPVPSCNSALDPSITEATMYNYQDCGETKKRSLDDDDILGVCTIYSIAKDPGSCEPVALPGGCSCQSANQPETMVLSLALAGLTLSVAGRRPRRRRYRR
ncbi:MAG: hypothetical protein AB7P03_10360 [Kofleriaceae bacterium]